MKPVIELGGSPGDTIKHTVDNGAEDLTDVAGLALSDANDRRAEIVVITCEDNAIRYTFGDTVPTNDGDTGVGHVLASGETLILRSNKQAQSLNFLNKVGDSVAVLQVTPYYYV